MNDWSAHPDVCIPIGWLSTGNPGCPYFEIMNGRQWEIWIKDSGEGESTIYTLTIDGEDILDFDEMPALWSGVDPDGP